MKIIVEGADNSGKSTLIRHLSGSLGIPVVPGEGPGWSDDEINERVRRYALIDNAIFDRHPCVSQPIYNHFRVGGPRIDDQLLSEFYQQDVLFIFCRGSGSLEGTVWRDVDQRIDGAGMTHEQNVRSNHDRICGAYDEWGTRHAHVVYRIGDGFAKVTAIVAALASYQHFDPVADIADFHRKFGLEYTGWPRTLPRDLADFRIKFMDEELNEYAQSNAAAIMEHSMQKADLANYTFHLEKMLDALVDEVYVVLGTSYLHGFDFREAWRRVHAANMRKVRAERAEDSKRGSTFDVIKPEGWEPPDHTDLVEVNDLSTTQRVSSVDSRETSSVSSQHVTGGLTAPNPQPDTAA